MVEIIAYKIVVGIPERMLVLERPMRGWEDNIKMGLKEIVWEGVYWIELVQDRVQWRAVLITVISLRLS
jgi:hypothetical protein